MPPPRNPRTPPIEDTQRYLDEPYTVAVADLDVCITRLAAMATGEVNFPRALDRQLLPLISQVRRLRQRLRLHQAQEPTQDWGWPVKIPVTPLSPKIVVAQIAADELGMDQGWFRQLIKASGIGQSTLYEWWDNYRKMSGVVGPPHAADFPTRQAFVDWLGQDERE